MPSRANILCISTAARMTLSLIVDQADFEELCQHIAKCGVVAFDTEFVSEFTLYPELCLLQFATPERVVAVDPFDLTDLSPWWNLMADDQLQVIVHGGREEVRFCLTQSGCRPQRLWDVQIAEGLRGRSFPLGYEALVRRVLGKTAHGRETRTDWRRRPLSEQQIEYALDDVAHVLEIWQRQRDSLQKQNRLHWAEAEFCRLIDETEAERAPEAWTRLSGVNRLNPREQAVAREIYRWRDTYARERNKPLRRVLRDDLIIELARRKPASENDLMSTRDMNRTEYRKVVPELLDCIKRGLATPAAQLPKIPKPHEDDKQHDEQVLGQLLSLALANRCAEMNVAQPLVGAASDLRQLVRWHVFGDHNIEAPRLLNGWRAEVCGDLLTDVLNGKISLRVADIHSDHPFVFERRQD